MAAQPQPQPQPQPVSTVALHGVDDFYFSALIDEDQADVDPISDDKYAEELQFQETLMSSLIASQNTINGSSSSSSAPPPPPPPTSSLFCLPSSSTPSSSKAVEFTLIPITKHLDSLDAADDDDEEEQQGDSLSNRVICEICAETKGCEQMFRNNGCDHSFCSDCVTKQVATKIQESITVVGCPGLNCRGVLELDACRPMLPKELLERWDKALCEALFLAAPKFYCPFRDCSEMLLAENEGENIREAECPFCHRLFCARCYVPWHPGVECELFQALNEDERGRDDLLVRELANENKWRRCPQCKYYVDKTQGCLHITCRCRFEFCYACGEQWTTTHGGCQRNEMILG